MKFKISDNQQKPISVFIAALGMVFLIYGALFRSSISFFIGVLIGVVWIVLTLKNAKPGENGIELSEEQQRSFKIALVVIGVYLIIMGVSSQIWLCVVLGLVLLSIRLFYRMKKQTKKTVEQQVSGKTNYRENEHGSAEWSEQVESVDEGLYIGANHLRKKSGHLITIAPSGQGKGVALIIPTLLVKPAGSYVVTDLKGENAFITARFQKSAGQNVYIIDPWNEQKKFGAIHNIESSGFNPFEFIKKDMQELWDSCEQIAVFLVPDNPNAKEPYWNDRARSMIKIFLAHIITALPVTEHNFWTLYKMLRYSGDEWTGLLFDLTRNTAEDGLIAIAGQELVSIEKAAVTMAGIKSGAQNATTIFESPQLRKSLEKDDFNPYSLTNGNCTVYIVIPERFLDTHSQWLRLVVGLTLKACNAKPNKRVNFILDEFAVLGKMKDIQRGYAFARGQNIVLWAFVQNLSQLKDIYGEDGMNNFISNSAVFMAFAAKDEYTKEYVSKLLGEGTFKKEGKSFSQGADSWSASTSFQSYGRRLFTPEEVETYQGIIAVIDGLRFKYEKLPYFKRAVSDLSLTAYNFRNEELIRQGKAPDFYYLFKDRADPPPRLID